MHQIGDKIMYGASGIMTVVDIRDEAIGNVRRSYFVLRPTLLNTDSYTFVPTDNERLVSLMRPLLSGEEIISLIRSAADTPPIEWVAENRARQEYFKRIIESGDRRQMIAMISAIDESGRRRQAEGKKNFITDENARAKALKLLYSEVSVVFGIPEEDAPAFVDKHGGFN